MGPLMPIDAQTREYLERHAVTCQTLPHPRSQSSFQAAEAAHVPPASLVKAVLLETDEEFMIAILPATEEVHLGRLHTSTGKRFRLAMPASVERLQRELGLGGLPVLGAAHGVVTLVDDDVLGLADIYFEVGEHDELLHLRGEDFRRLIENSPHWHFAKPHRAPG